MRNTDLVFALLGLKKRVPLTEQEMARALRVTYYPPHQRTSRTDRFVTDLTEAFVDAGVDVLPYADTLVRDDKDRVGPGIVVVEQGEGDIGNLAIRNVSGLYQNPLVAVYDGDFDISAEAGLQETLDAIVGVLAWNLTHVPIFVGEKTWTICTMNGAVIRCDDKHDIRDDVLHALIPKLAAQVVPPKRSEVEYHEGALVASRNGYGDYIKDFMDSARIWRDNGLMVAHTSIESLPYRSRYHRRIVASYLDNRTGMSYGFMVRQLPVSIQPATRKDQAPASLRDAFFDGTVLQEVDGQTYALVDLLGEHWFVPIPDVWVLSTRSGCEKTNINPERDILRLGLQRGQVIVETPPGITAMEARPSYDTLAILAHSVGNAIAGSILLALGSGSVFPKTLQRDGLTISHWHGYPPPGYDAAGYVLHGQNNPPVSCSTPQSAVFALAGKLKALERSVKTGSDYLGDIHVEPHHGTNITGCKSLAETARWVDQMFTVHAE